MKRLIFALVMAVLFFTLLNFVYCNLGGDVFGYRVVFKFSIPYILAVQSTPLPMGFVILAAFCTGMITIALLEALPSFFKTLEIRSKNKKIRQLERELSVVRQLSDKPAELPEEEKIKNPGVSS
ncbi:MAG: LapA family protein [Proteobacteria bacterium]|nr:LapA family protein [Pseudomonadota bacterium]